MPHPVPRSNARPTDTGTINSASVRDAPDTEHMVSRQRSAEREFVEVAGDPPFPDAVGIHERLRTDQRRRFEIRLIL